MKLLLLAALFPLAHPALATVIRFDGDGTPDGSKYGASWSTVVFSGTNWSSNGSELSITTAPSRGIWFGWANYVGDTPAWSISDNLTGNHVSIRARLGASSGEWETYITDTSGYHTSINFNDAGSVSWFWNDATGLQSVTIAIDTTEYHTYELLMKQGLVTFIVDDLVRGQAFNTASGGIPILLYGDGSGSTPTGFGSMFVEYAMIDTAPIPEPSSAFLVGLVSLSILRRKRH